MNNPNSTKRMLALAQAVLFWEALWPALLPILCVAGLFIALALLEVPTALSVIGGALGGWLHSALLGLFVLSSGAAIWLGVRRWQSPDHDAARRRVERDSGLAHRPLATLEDGLSNRHDNLAAALWRSHRRRASAQLQNLSVGLPRPGLPQGDPWSLRALVFLLLIAGLFIGRADAPDRLRLALTPDFSAHGAVVAELEAWINPPDYTGLPPMKLNPASTEPVAVVEGSTLMARVFGGQDLPRLSVDGAVTPFKKIDEHNFEVTQTITAGLRLSVASDEGSLADWPLSIIIDQPPTIKSAAAPKVTARQAVRLSYEAADDYGLARVWAELSLPNTENSGNSGIAAAAVELELPVSPPGTAKAKDGGFFDLTPHPWAGRLVQLHFLARDEKGQIGRSAPIAMLLPEREFKHLVARAIIEQRRDLSRNLDRRLVVAYALFAIGSGPETYGHDHIAYLGLRTAARRLQYGGDRSVAEVVDLLWKVALRIEDGSMSLAERELRAAQDALMAALSNGADQAEIERLMDELQKAMEKYLQALAEQAQDGDGDQARGPQQADPNARTIDADELQKMMDRIRELSRLGATDAAREMLRQLQEMLENMEARKGTAQQPGNSPGQKAMNQLGDLLQKQQGLMDKTYQQTPRRRRMPWEKRQGQREGSGQGEGKGQNQGTERGKGMTTGKRKAMQGLAGRQGNLRQQLGDVLRQLGEGMGRIPEAMGGVDRAMRQSQQALRSGRGGQALSNQRQAIEGLAESFRELAEEMMRNAQQDGQGTGQGEVDPAGRPYQGGGTETSRVMVPDGSDLQRARHILEELRRRAGERARARLERDYIERLLERF